MSNEVEDGMGFSGLAPTAQEQANDVYWDTRNKVAKDREKQLAEAVARNAELLAALSAAGGYLMNAKIDLETGAPKRTAIRTIEGGLQVVNAAIAKTEGRAQ